MEAIHNHKFRGGVIVLLALCVFIFVGQIEVYADSEVKKLQITNSDIEFNFNTDEVLKYSETHYEIKENDVSINIMIDDLRDTEHKAYNTSVYSGRYFGKSKYVNNYKYQKLNHLGYTSHIYTFERDPLLHGPDLNRQFVYIEIELEEQVLLSLHIKSKETLELDVYLDRIIKNSGIQMELGDYRITVDNEIENNAVLLKNQYLNEIRDFDHEKTREKFDQIFAGSSEMTWGIFDPSTHYELSYVDAIENNTGIELDIILEYYDLGYLPRVDKMKEINDTGRVLELTFQTSKYGTFDADALYDVLDGKHDAQIDALISRIKESDEPVLFRPNNEMNGDWCSYNSMYTHKDTEAFKTFWKWLYNRFEEADCENVIWVWNPNWGDFPHTEWNHYLQYFPGNAYVDVVGLTGYNTGTYYKAEEWRSFSEIYMPMLWEYDKHFKNFPYMITEFGSSATGGNKGEWIASAFNQLSRLDIKAAVWWNHVDYDTQSGVVSRGYKFNNDPDVMDIFRKEFNR